MDIAEFVKARLDEDERIAKGLAGATRFMSGRPDFYGQGGPAADAYWDHFTPGRVQHEVAAKRRILWDHTPQTTGRRTACSRCHYGNVLGANWPCLTMTSLAGTWNDHPDFDPEWTP